MFTQRGKIVDTTVSSKSSRSSATESSSIMGHRSARLPPHCHLSSRSGDDGGGLTVVYSTPTCGAASWSTCRTCSYSTVDSRRWGRVECPRPPALIQRLWWSADVLYNYWSSLPPSSYWHRSYSYSWKDCAKRHSWPSNHHSHSSLLYMR